MSMFRKPGSVVKDEARLNTYVMYRNVKEPLTWSSVADEFKTTKTIDLPNAITTSSSTPTMSTAEAMSPLRDENDEKPWSEEGKKIFEFLSEEVFERLVELSVEYDSNKEMIVSILSFQGPSMLYILYLLPFPTLRG
jgi:hypothetical protein